MGNEIAAAALSLVGTPFRLNGRHIETGLDCVGLVLMVADRVGVTLKAPHGYTLRNARPVQYDRWLHQPSLHLLPSCEPAISGDIYMVRPAPHQLHLMIGTDMGFVHAHAGLRRVVAMSPPSPWPIVRRLRIISPRKGG